MSNAKKVGVNEAGEGAMEEDGRYKHVNKADGSDCFRYQSAIDIRGRSVHGSVTGCH